MLCCSIVFAKCRILREVSSETGEGLDSDGSHFLHARLSSEQNIVWVCVCACECVSVFTCAHSLKGPLSTWPAQTREARILGPEGPGISWSPMQNPLCMVSPMALQPWLQFPLECVAHPLVHVASSKARIWFLPEHTAKGPLWPVGQWEPHRRLHSCSGSICWGGRSPRLTPFTARLLFGCLENRSHTALDMKPALPGMDAVHSAPGTKTPALP